MENKKVTKREMFGALLEIVKGNEEMENFINHEIELLDRKKSTGTQTKTQIENETIKVAILDALVNVAKQVTITELQALDTNMSTYSNQKLSALLKQLVEEGKVERIVDKKKSYFQAK